jgi:hypothetical protein
VTGSGTADYIPLWSTARKLGSSVLFQSGTGATAEVGINTTTPASTLDVKGTVTATSFSGAGAVMTGTNVDGVLQVTNTNTSGFGPAIFGTANSSGAYGVTGIVSATTGTTAGVRGETNSTSGYGVLGTSPDVGVYGNATGQSVTGGTYGILSGVWGDTGTSGEYGVLGTADDAAAGSFINNSSSGYAALTAQNLSTTGGNNVFITYGVGNNGCEIGNLGNLSCSGTITAHVSGAGPRQVSVYAMQSAENWFEDAGSGQLTNGSASISLDPAFAQTVNTGVEYHVFLTPNGDCKGLYVSQKSANSFEVHELGGGASSIAFDYRIMAKRAGYENVRLADVTEKYQKMEKQHQMLHERMAQRRAERSSAGPIPAAAARPQ